MSKLIHSRISLICILTLFCASIFSSCQSTLDRVVVAELKKEADEGNKKAPYVSQGIRVDSFSANGKTMQVSFTVLNAEKGSIDQSGFSREVKTNLAKTMGSDSRAAMFKKGGATIIYAYYYNDGTLIAKVTMKPEDY